MTKIRIASTQKVEPKSEIRPWLRSTAMLVIFVVLGTHLISGLELDPLTDIRGALTHYYR